MNSFTQTIDLTALRRRLEEQDAAGRSDATARLYGRGRPGTDGGRDADGTQFLYRDPAGYRRRPPADDADELGLRDLDRVEEPRRAAPATWARDGEAATAPKGSTRGRALWTLLDQLISSGTNSILMFVVAREVVPAEFGAFSVAFAVFAVVIGFSKSTGGQPLSIRYAGAPASVFSAAAAKATGSALVLGVGVGLGCAVVGTLMGGAVGSALLTLAVVLPGLLVQDLWRQVFFAQGRPAAAAANDAVWGVVQIAGVAVLLTRHVALASPMLLAWGAAAAVAALIGVVQAGFWPAPGRALDWVREHRDINGYLAAEFVTVQGALNATLLVIGAIGTIELVGALRGVQTLLGPTTIFAIGIVSWAIPEFAQRKDMTAAARLRAAYLLSAAVATLGIIWGLVFLVFGQIKFGGTPLGEHLLGDTWANTHHLLGLSIIQQAGAASTVGVSCMLIALGRAKDTFRLNVIMAPQLLLYPLLGVYLGGGTGAVIGFIVANWVMVPAWFRLLRRAARDAEREWDETNAPGDRGARATGTGGNQPDQVSDRLEHSDRRDRRGERDRDQRSGPGRGAPASKHQSVE
ncbi:hypothetical protein [Pseudofrankia asymbiotica]|uniref:Polysaccharide biosynthesis protein n=1 Tax=Pseudofrankia asymbiotica TaxID=1834516 RepID=A0A1V2IKN7_9ACTN|nr:hypothetical protein [Pseudofrankia asymbiotica]ONH33677.1 hypothetical protein BL253_01295 [Pseudofrankia asymbiotica]